MSENYHYVQLIVEDGELHRAFACTAPGDADCRRRPSDWGDGERESWTAEEATEKGYPCWAVEWVEAVGIEDAICAHPDGVLASVPVAIRYAEGVEVEILADQGEPQISDAMIQRLREAFAAQLGSAYYPTVEEATVMLEAALSGGED